MNELVSIVIPVYNQEKYLDTSIPSVLGQEYSNLQVIVVDDGSTDRSAEIIERYALQDERIKVVTQENGGLIDATIAGIRNSTGTYICFLDPDDFLGSDFVLNLVKEIADCDFVAAGFFVENGGALTPIHLMEDRVYSQDELVYFREHYYKKKKGADLSRRFFISRCNKLYRLECAKNLAHTFEQCKGVSLGEDAIFTYLMLLNSKKGKTLKRTNSYYYNLGNASSMTRLSDVEVYMQKATNAFSTLRRLLLQNGNSDIQAYSLYFILIESLFTRQMNDRSLQFGDLYGILRKDDEYQKAMSHMLRSSSLGTRADLTLRRLIRDPHIYVALKGVLLFGGRCFRFVKPRS